jgi:hypothetical protein
MVEKEMEDESEEKVKLVVQPFLVSVTYVVVEFTNDAVV